MLTYACIVLHVVLVLLVSTACFGTAEPEQQTAKLTIEINFCVKSCESVQQCAQM